MVRTLSKAGIGVLVAGAAMLGLVQDAGATLLGDTVVFELVVDGSSTVFGPAAAVAGAGVEYDLTELTVDVDALSIQVDVVLAAPGAPQIDWIFTDLDVAGGILGAILTVFDGPPAAFGITHTANSITVSNLEFTADLDGPFFRIDIVQAVPEPATLAILGVGLAGLALLRCRDTV